MASLFHLIVNATSSAMSAFRGTTDSPSEDNNSQSPSPCRSRSFDDGGPHVSDVLAVKRMLLLGPKLPLEIVDTIIDYAEYWPHASVVTNKSYLATGAHVNRTQDNGDVFTIRSLPLGYVHDSEAKFALPLESKYGKIRRDLIPNNIDFGDVAKSTIAEILEEWAIKSQPRTQHPCMKIVFTMRSRDQGWGGSHLDHGTYRGSFTWFDAGLERIEAIDRGKYNPQASPDVDLEGDFALADSTSRSGQPIRCYLRSIIPRVIPIPGSQGHRLDHPFLPPSSKLQANLMASRDVREHVVTWSHNDDIHPESPEGDHLESIGRGRDTGTGEFVRNLKIGDIVTVWARARFPGWTNQVEEVKIDVYWAV